MQCHIERNEVESKYLNRIEISPRAMLGRNDSINRSLDRSGEVCVIDARARRVWLLAMPSLRCLQPKQKNETY